MHKVGPDAYRWHAGVRKRYVGNDVHLATQMHHVRRARLVHVPVNGNKQARHDIRRAGLSARAGTPKGTKPKFQWELPTLHKSIAFLSFSPLSCFSGVAGPEETANPAGEMSSVRFRSVNDVEFIVWKNLVGLSDLPIVRNSLHRASAQLKLCAHFF